MLSCFASYKQAISGCCELENVRCGKLGKFAKNTARSFWLRFDQLFEFHHRLVWHESLEQFPLRVGVSGRKVGGQHGGAGTTSCGTRHFEIDKYAILWVTRHEAGTSFRPIDLM